MLIGVLASKFAFGDAGSKRRSAGARKTKRVVTRRDGTGGANFPVWKKFFKKKVLGWPKTRCEIFCKKPLTQKNLRCPMIQYTAKAWKTTSALLLVLDPT